MKPGGGGIQPESSLVVQVNSNTNNYGSSPNKKKEEEETEGIIEKRPKFYNHLPLSYQIVMQDHNYCAMPPSPTALLSPKPSHSSNLSNGVTLSNGISRQPTPLLAPPIPFIRSGYPRGPTPEVLRTPEIIRNIKVDPDESDISSDGEAPPGNIEDGEETETAPEDEDSVTRCICEFQHDDGYMICCDKCLVWQHVDCMGIERGNIPEEYRCEECEPRKIDKARAIKLQVAKRSQFNDSSDSSSATTPPKSSVGRNTGTNNARKGSNPTPPRNVTRRRGERGGKSGRWRTTSESKRGKYSKPTGKQKQRKTISRKRRESTSEKKESPTSGSELRSPSPSDNIHQLRQWIDQYEEAVTNHYSQELRARISAIKVNGLYSELRHNNSYLPSTLKAKLYIPPSGIKMLIATAHIAANQAIIEVRGKYMLSKGVNAQANGKQQFIFHHRLNGPGPEVTEVQVDASTYGNDARFVRSSCTPNAEIRHCIEKGTLHLYLVSTCTIEPKTEITLPHRPGIAICASGDKCTIILSGNDKRRRGRRRTLSESSTSLKSTSLNINNNNNNNNNNKEPPNNNKRPHTISLSPEPQPPVNTLKVSKPPSNSALSPPLTRETSSKITRGQVSTRRATTPAAKSEERKRNTTASPPKKHDGKLTREERKMEAIMKAFERLEKDEQRKQHTTGTGTASASGATGRARKSSTSLSLSPVRERQDKLRKKSIRETRSSKSLRPRRSATSKLLNSTPPPRRITRRRAQSEETETDESDGVSVGGSGPPTPGTPPLPEPPVYEASTPVKEEDSVIQETLNSSGSDSTPPPAVSNACLLVAAAVGPLAPGFKFPKTKKNILNSWFGGGEIVNDEVTPRTGIAPLDCAKKRWLRQAISEDSDSPKQEPGVVSPTEMAAPLKKRRFARESISSEMSSTPPETPQIGDTQPQLYEDDNSMEPQGSRGEVTHSENHAGVTELPGGPRTPPAIRPTNNTDGAPTTPITTPQKSPFPSSESTEEGKPLTPVKAKEEARVKRKLSISEYRERVKSNPSKINSENAHTPQAPPPPPAPVTPSVEDMDTDSDDFLSNSIIFNVPAPPIDTAFKKGPPVSGFNAAPTLVEQQREALTERLRREFGLLLSDDEDEKNKKGSSGTEMLPIIGPPLQEIKKKRKQLPPPPPPPLPPLGHPPPPPPPTNEWIYYQHPPTQYRFTSTF